MTRHLCIATDILRRSHGQAGGLFVKSSSRYPNEPKFDSEADRRVESSVTNLMQRAAPSNFAFKWPAGRSPLPALKRLLYP
jgi:hypothetical protein